MGKIDKQTKRKKCSELTGKAIRQTRQRDKEKEIPVSEERKMEWKRRKERKKYSLDCERK